MQIDRIIHLLQKRTHAGYSEEKATRFSKAPKRELAAFEIDSTAREPLEAQGRGHLSLEKSL